MTLTERVAQWCAGTTWEALPPEVIACAKRLVLDTLAVGWAGTASEGVAGIVAMAADEGGRSEATLWGLDRRATPTQAAFINGVTSAALDYDSLHQAAMSHACIVTLPAVLALAERCNASGRDFLTAFVLGNELHCRLGLSTTAHSGWFYTSMHGVFGAALGAARMLGLDRDAMRNALGIALSHAGGTQQPHIEKSLTKRMQSAFAARNGVFSALLAQRGVDAPREALEGKFGFYAKYERGDPAIVIEGLGTRWEILRTLPKKFPSCACNHAAIEATLQLARESRLKREDVRAIEVVISPFMARLVAAPYDPRGNPQVNAQFSVQYSIASALLRGHLGIADIEPAAACDPDLVAYARSITMRVDETLTDPSSMAATVLIDTRDRGRVIRTIEHLPGSPEFPLTVADVQAKFAECTSRGASPLSPGQASALAARVEGLDGMADVSRLFDGMTGAASAMARERVN